MRADVWDWEDESNPAYGRPALITDADGNEIDFVTRVNAHTGKVTQLDVAEGEMEDGGLKRLHSFVPAPVLVQFDDER